jgi:hypothetical protein
MDSELEKIISQLNAAPSSRAYEAFASYLSPKKLKSEQKSSYAIAQSLPRILNFFRRDIDVNNTETETYALLFSFHPCI